VFCFHTRRAPGGAGRTLPFSPAGEGGLSRTSQYLRFLTLPFSPAGEGGLSRTSQYLRFLISQMEQLRMIKEYR
jgi:hypothetical protein